MRFLQRLYTLALHHPPITHKDKFLYLELLLKDLDLIDYGGRIGGVARKHPHRERFAFRVGQQTQNDLQFPLLAIAVVAELTEFVLLLFQITASDVVEKHARWLRVLT